MIVWSIVEESLSFCLLFSSSSYSPIALNYQLLLLYPVFYLYFLTLLFGLLIMHSKSFVALVIGTNWNKIFVEFVPY